ncbi:hypothetical protein UPYG_G00128750 [Umbra pygmaea]|uniref:Ig-like domain-containing protein n=1 Tax=Umbra pygmaea TaxID=75934 RepID=A0ABD0XLU0_UMBPY
MREVERVILIGWLIQGICNSGVEGTNCLVPDTSSYKPSVSVDPIGPVLEGKTVTLTCKSNATQALITWYSKTDRLTSFKDFSNVLKVNIMADNTEFYCEVNSTCGSQRSEVLQLEVLYKPKTISVSVNPTDPVKDGATVELQCSSTGNPKVSNFTWYSVQGDQVTLLGTGNVLRTKVCVEVHQFFCEAKNNQGANNSTWLMVKVLYPPQNTSVSAHPSSPVLEKSQVTLTCSSNANPPVSNYSWYSVDDGHTNTLKESEHNLTVASANGKTWYYCKAENQYGSDNSTAIQLNIYHPPRNTSLSVSLLNSASEDSSVVLTCSSEAEPPVDSYTWYKETGKQVVIAGTGQNLTLHIAQVIDEGEYYCKAQNPHGEDQSTHTNGPLEFTPWILPSSRCLHSKSQVSCTCDSKGSPTPSVQWYLSGQLIKHSLATPIKEEPLGRTHLRSTLTFHWSEQDMPTPLCLSSNSQGSTRLKLCVDSAGTSTGYQTLLMGIGAGAAGMMFLGVVAFLIARRMRTLMTWDLKPEDKTDLILTDWTLSQEEDSASASKVTQARSTPAHGATHPRPQQPNGDKGEVSIVAGLDHNPPMDAANHDHRLLPHCLETGHDLPQGDWVVEDRGS